VLIALLLYAHFVAGAGVVGYHWYLVFATTLVTIVAWTVLSSAARGGLARGAAIWAAFLAVTIGLIVPVLITSTNALVTVWWGTVAICSGALVVSVLSRSSRWSRTALAVAAISIAGAFVPISPLAVQAPTAPIYRSVTKADKSANHANRAAEGLRSMAIQFLNIVQREVPAGDSFLVYYPDSDVFRSIQSTTLWGYSCIDCAAGAPAFPRFTSQGAEQIRATGTEKLVFIARSRAELESVQREAARLRTPFDTIGDARRITGGDQQAWVGVSRRRQ
jgi:hypothetical protein